MMRRPKGVNCRMASHSTYGWKNYVDTYAFKFGEHFQDRSSADLHFRVLKLTYYRRYIMRGIS
jgi:hypothetical protein